jgi:hypothetical protein
LLVRLFLKVGKDVGGRLDLEVEVLHSVTFYVFGREKLVDFLIGFSILDLSSQLILELSFKGEVEVARLLLFERELIEFAYLLEANQIFHIKEGYDVLPHFAVVEHIIQFDVFQIDEFLDFRGIF